VTTREADPKCGAPAFAKVFWPGRQTLVMCERHAYAAERIAAVLGADVPQEPCEDGTCEHLADIAR